jgi:AraC family transcriptional regulator
VYAHIACFASARSCAAAPHSDTGVTIWAKKHYLEQFPTSDGRGIRAYAEWHRCSDRNTATILSSTNIGLMQAQKQEELKYPSSTLLKSSDDLGWSAMSAELRSYSRSEGPGPVAPHAKISIAVRGSDEGLVTCKIAGSWKSGRPTTGSIWLKPIGGKYDEARFCLPKVQVLHLCVPNVFFARLMDDYNLPPAPARSVRYSCGVQDGLINQIGLSVLSEMMSPTAAGRMLVETSSLLLAARLAHAHLETELIGSPIQSRHGLDHGRLRRVLAYIEEHLAEDITVADLANVACLSIFHFTRAFAGSMGVPPHRYLSRRRLESAKAMIATGRASLSEIALDCQFSSQSSFTRAFRRATGMTPAEYGRTLR